MGAKELVRDVGLYVIVDPAWLGSRGVEEIVSQIVAGGGRAIQLRDKGSNDRQFCHLALRVRRLTADRGTLLLINDRVDVARGVGADGVHVGQEDLPARIAREILGEEAIIGVSAETASEAIEAEASGADYIGVGPMFPTKVKPTDRPVGPGRLREIKKVVGIPVLGIGGITAETAGEVIRAGADGVAVIRAVICALDVAAATEEIKRRVDSAKLRRHLTEC